MKNQKEIGNKTYLFYFCDINQNTVITLHLLLNQYFEITTKQMFICYYIQTQLYLQPFAEQKVAVLAEKSQIRG